MATVYKQSVYTDQSEFKPKNLLQFLDENPILRAIMQCKYTHTVCNCNVLLRIFFVVERI